MPEVKTRREMYAEQTRTALVEEATRQFADVGFAGTSLDKIAQATQVTRGAVYHHFTSKKALFEAVVEEQEKRVVDEVAAVLGAQDDLWAGAMSAIDAYLDLCMDPVYSAIVWREGLLALGLDGVEECAQKYSYGLVEGAARAMVDAGYFDDRAFDTTTRLVFHLIGCAAQTIAEAGPADGQRVRDECADVVKRMFAGLRTDE